jgi:predicted transcriptional regulator
MMDEAAARRASQVCRILGNPLAYRIVRRLVGARLRPMELARELRASPTSIVNQLKHLKIAGVVRYRSTGVRRGGRCVEYWLADPSLGRCVEGLERCLGRLPR